MNTMIPQTIVICNDYFSNTIPFFPLNSTHTKFAFGQNRVTERKSLSSPESGFHFPEYRKGENSYEQQEQ